MLVSYVLSWPKRKWRWLSHAGTFLFDSFFYNQILKQNNTIKKQFFYLFLLLLFNPNVIFYWNDFYYLLLCEFYWFLRHIFCYHKICQGHFYQMMFVMAPYMREYAQSNKISRLQKSTEVNSFRKTATKFLWILIFLFQIVINL